MSNETRYGDKKMIRVLAFVIFGYMTVGYFNSNDMVECQKTMSYNTCNQMINR